MQLRSLESIFCLVALNIYCCVTMIPRLFRLNSLLRYERILIPNLMATCQLNGAAMLHTSVTSVSGIDTGSITNLPSGVVGKEENVNGETLFSIEEGLAKVYFPSTTPEEVFYNQGKSTCLGVGT